MDYDETANEQHLSFLQEQKKLRKQRRQADLQDKRDRIRMGLIPPDAPKGARVSSPPMSPFLIISL